MELNAQKIEGRIKRARFMSRVCMGLAVFTCTLSVILVVTMYQMGSRLQVVPQLFPVIGGSDMMVYADVLDSNVINLRSLEWAFVQRFIEEKTFLIPDQYEMFRRWNPYSVLASMALPREEAFRPVYKTSDDEVKDVEMKQITHAENIRLISVNNHVWSVSFDECVQGVAGPSCRPKQANVFVAQMNNRKSFYSSPSNYMNPFGFVVTKYIVQDRRA